EHLAHQLSGVVAVDLGVPQQSLHRPHRLVGGEPLPVLLGDDTLGGEMVEHAGGAPGGHLLDRDDQPVDVAERRLLVLDGLLAPRASSARSIRSASTARAVRAFTSCASPTGASDASGCVTTHRVFESRPRVAITYIPLASILSTTPWAVSTVRPCAAFTVDA